MAGTRVGPHFPPQRITLTAASSLFLYRTIFLCVQLRSYGHLAFTPVVCVASRYFKTHRRLSQKTEKLSRHAISVWASHSVHVLHPGLKKQSVAKDHGCTSMTSLHPGLKKQSVAKDHGCTSTTSTLATPCSFKTHPMHSRSHTTQSLCLHLCVTSLDSR